MSSTRAAVAAREKSQLPDWQPDCRNHSVFERSLHMRTLLLAALICTPLVAESNEPAKRLEESAAVFSEFMSAPDKGIPDELLEKAQCIVIVPGLKKGAFIVGGQYGKGYLTCRRQNGRGWSAPGTVRMEGGSVGFQIGGSETDVIMLVMNQRGADRLMQSEFTVGGEGEVAAGPVGRTASAQTDAKLSAEMLSYSRSRGVFAGVALKGTTLRADPGENEVLYGKERQTR